ncbi:ANTAR domain-containing protein [Mycolicibacterium hodleri]|nr:ANTAR domain-containing protein [Mycolicibacterium hodleri]
MPHYSHDQVDAIVANRAAIEQAKGILMFVHAIDGVAAFHLLRSQSRTSRIKLRLLAEQFINDVSALTFDERLDLETACSHLLLTAHERVRRGPESYR